jgi:hypothetical protein
MQEWSMPVTYTADGRWIAVAIPHKSSRPQVAKPSRPAAKQKQAKPDAEAFSEGECTTKDALIAMGIFSQAEVAKRTRKLFTVHRWNNAYRGIPDGVTDIREYVREFERMNEHKPSAWQFGA